MSHRPAGGLKSRNVVNKPMRVGPGGRAINKNWVSQIGSSQGDHITHRGEPLPDPRSKPYKGFGFQPVPLGNSLTNNVGTGGPGKGRVLYGQSGSQGTQGPVNPGRSPQRKDILSEYGPDKR